MATLAVTASGTSTREKGALQRLLRHPLARIGLFLLALLLAAAVFARYLGSGDPGLALPQGLDELGVPHGPGDGFPLGADTLGRDVLSRLAYGARVSLLVALCAMATSVTIGTTLGLLGGYFGGWVDSTITRLTEIVSCLPTILLAMTLAFIIPDSVTQLGIFKLGNMEPPDPGLVRLLLAIGLVTWTNIARAVRGQTLALKEREFIEAARAMGCSGGTILKRHLLPNVLPTVVTLATLATANNILLEAGLSYLGLGSDPSRPSWGGMISEGQPYLMTAPWIVLAPGLAIVLAVTAFNLLGTALQEVLDAKR